MRALHFARAGGVARSACLLVVDGVAETVEVVGEAADARVTSAFEAAQGFNHGRGFSRLALDDGGGDPLLTSFAGETHGVGRLVQVAFEMRSVQDEAQVHKLGVECLS